MKAKGTGVCRHCCKWGVPTYHLEGEGEENRTACNKCKKAMKCGITKEFEQACKRFFKLVKQGRA